MRRKFTAAEILVFLGVLAAVGTLASWFAGQFPGHAESPVSRKVFVNIPAALEGMFYVAVAGFLFLTFYLFALRAKNWQRGAPDRRTGHWRERLEAMGAGLRMQTLMRDRGAGLMHSMVYYGFVVLFLGTVTLEIDHLLPAAFKFLQDDVYRAYSFILDAAALVFLGGLAWAFVRRYGQAPWRLRSKTRPEDFWILVTLALIGVSGLATEAARIAVENRPSYEVWSFVGYPLSLLVPQVSAAGIHQVIWIIHVASFLAFLVVLPTTKLRHMVTSPVNMFLGPKERPPGAMREMPNLMEVDDIETVGASLVGEFTWKQLLDTDACTVCGRCTSVCPATATGKPLDPREIVLKLGEVAARTADPAVTPPVSVDEAITVSADNVFERITPEELWACTSCKACDEICPVDIEILDKILDMRRYLALMEADFPAELGKAYLSMENSSNPYGMGQADRAAWTAELDFEVPILGQDVDTAEYLYWVGCAGSFDDRNRKVTVATARLLHEAGVSFAILGPAELCTGDPARRSGNEFVFQMLAIQNVETLEDRGVRKVITQCPHCFNTLKNEYPQFGGDYEVIHHSQVLSDLVSQGLLRTRNGKSKTVTYHDSCYLGRHNGVYMAPRGVVASIGGINVVEMGRSGTRSFCCGAGGAQMWMEERVGKKVNIDRAEEAVATGADEVAVACPFCYVMLDDGVRELGEEESVAVRDISMILADSVFED
ncbi:MAG: heterodisulfide reductase-related iron-sulfur binding cluster [bacterium]|nr:heterodisulfide reductase-related iron-sulfur binding cluster [bacterium]MDE0353103.1 heterodisulfide reductase-related iron-sulfur binding cluster [bacterium]